MDTLSLLLSLLLLALFATSTDALIPLTDEESSKHCMTAEQACSDQAPYKCCAEYTCEHTGDSTNPYDTACVAIGADKTAALTPLTDENIKEAVALWCVDPESATVTYGHISSWDTGGVTNMMNLFFGGNDARYLTLRLLPDNHFSIITSLLYIHFTSQQSLISLHFTSFCQICSWLGKFQR